MAMPVAARQTARMGVGVEINKRLVFVNSASTVLRRFLTIAIAAWLHQHLLLRISAEEYSLLPVLMALMIFVPLVSMVFTSGLSRFVTEAYARGDEKRVTQVVSTMFPLLVGAALALLILGGLFSWNIARVLTVAPEFVDEARTMFALLILGAAVRMASIPFELGFDVKQRFILRNGIGVGAELARIAFLLTLLAVFGTHVVWVVVAFFAADLCERFVVVVLSRRMVPALCFNTRDFRREIVKPMTSFGGWSLVAHVATLVREAADPLILNKLATPVDVSTFGLASLVELHLRRTIFGTARNAQPAIVALQATGQTERLRRTYFRLSRYMLWALLLACLPLIIFCREFFDLYLRERSSLYTSAAVVLALLVARSALLFPNTLISMVAEAQARVRPLALRGLAMQSANLALTIYLVGGLGMGAFGSALSTLAVSAVAVPLLFWSFGLELTGARAGPWVRSALLRGVVPGLVATPVWIAVKLSLEPDTWLELGVAGAAGCAVYAAAVFFSLSREERQDLGRLLARRSALVGRNH